MNFQSMMHILVFLDLSFISHTVWASSYYRISNYPIQELLLAFWAIGNFGLKRTDTLYADDQRILYLW